MLAAKIEAKTVPKRERLKNQKICFRIGGGSILEGRGVSKIDEKSMPKPLQDKIGIQEGKNRERGANIGPSWTPKSSQVEEKSMLKLSST